jgi:uncharacterized protein
MTRASTAEVPSPCISVCRMDEDSGLCSGCLRTLDEIAVWSLLDAAEKQTVWLQIGRRRLAARERLAGGAGLPPGAADAAP